MTDQIDTKHLRELAEAATPGPWHWAGNTDTGEPYLATWIPGAGRCQVLSIGSADRDPEGPEAKSIRDSMIDCGYSEDDADDYVREWATDSFGSPRTDPRLQFMTDLMCADARDLAIYEVAPDATSREDPEVYRADVVGIRHPDATYIAAASPQTMIDLLDELKRVTEQRDALQSRIDAALEVGGAVTNAGENVKRLWAIRKALSTPTENGEEQ